MRASRFIAGVTAGLIAVLGGCAGEMPAANSTAPPRGVSVSLRQWRADETAHELEVAVRNDTTTPVYFADVRLVTESFRTLPPTWVNVTLARTPRTDLKIPYGVAVCGPVRVPDMRPATVIAHIRVGDEPLHEVRFALPHPDQLLGHLLATECGSFILSQKVNISFGDSWTTVRGDGTEKLRGTLSVTRMTGDEDISIDELGSTTNFNLRPSPDGHRPVATLPAGERQVVVPVVVTPARCDEHAFAEAKKGFLFPIYATAGERHYVIVEPSAAGKATFVAYAKKVCGLP
jgi:hypothetical protein